MAQVDSAASSLTVAPTIRRFDAEGNEISRSYPAPNQLGISSVDCQEDSSIEYTVTGTGTATEIQVWAALSGAGDCTQATARGGPTGVCWQPYGSFAFRASPQQVRIRARDMLSQASSRPTTAGYSPAGIEACTQPGVGAGLTAIVLYFMIINSQNVINSQTVNVPLKLRGPAAPVLQSVTAGESTLYANIAPPTDPDLRGFSVYCDPLPAEEDPARQVSETEVDPAAGIPACVSPPFAASTTTTSSFARRGQFLRIMQDLDGGDGTGDDGGSGGGTTGVVVTDGGTSTGGTTGGIVDPRYECVAALTSFATTLEVKNVRVGFAYNIAVASIDSFGNRGEISTIECARPVPTDNFWNGYRLAGGSFTGSLCALRAPGAPVRWGMGGGLGVAAVAFGCGALLRRRRRQK
jgi:hypothetical protein